MSGPVVLALRASPDWGGMAADFAAGGAVEPARFMPADNPYFPLDMPDHITRWNRLSAVSFFACRERLREIAARNLARIADITVIRARNVSAHLDDAEEGPGLLFHLDDDDWFHPDMVAILAGLDLGEVDAVVLPFYRLATKLVTFTRDGAAIRGAIGRCEGYRYRYCTNNYGLTRRALGVGSQRLVEHIGASDTADAQGFVDLHHDLVISATSKSPCSASWVRELPADAQAYRDTVRNYLEVIADALDRSPHAWVNTPLRETHDLFVEVLG